tara:strand:+ start:4991 stop:5710 length:720 start_codon:yes stop_codon:yes gene_type:complete
MIELVNVSKSFINFNPLSFKQIKEIEILTDISFEIKEKDIVGIIGKNGAGKSTILKLLFGSLKPDSGEIMLDGSSDYYVEESKNFSLINNNERSFFWRLTLRQNLDYFQSITGKANNEIIDLLLEDLSIEKFLDKPFYALSSGEKKKALLYRGLLKDPKVIFFDEYTQSLDLPSKRQIIHFIKKLNKDFERTIFWVTHDLSEINDLCNKLLIVKNKGVSCYENLKEADTFSNLERYLGN